MQRNVAKILLMLAAITSSCTTATAAPAYPFDGLLLRARTVFVGSIVQLTKHGGKLHVSFRVDDVLRGNKAFIPDRIPIARNNEPGLDADWWADTQYVVISQGDAIRGEPLPSLRFDQGTLGQAGYRGWIAFRLLPRTKNREPTLKGAFEYVGRKRQDLTISRARELVKEGMQTDEKGMSKN